MATTMRACLLPLLLAGCTAREGFYAREPPNSPGDVAGADAIGDPGGDTGGDLEARQCLSNLDCEEDNPCTEGRCDERGQCQVFARGGPCDDGDPCTKTSTCDAGVCVPGPVDKDSDQDGFVDALCPSGNDCDDDAYLVNRGASEGMSEEDTCFDGLDNDCDGWTDDPADGCPRLIIRSVGFDSTGPLCSSAEQPVEIANGKATFAFGLPDNVGVGDALSYDLDGDAVFDGVVFVHHRRSSRQLLVRDARGLPPNDVSAGVWVLHRAYTSLASAESGSENPGIAPEVRDFDAWSNGRDLVANDETFWISCYGDAPHVGGVVLEGWNTSARNFLRIYTPYRPTEVGASQRHQGKWDASRFTLENAADVIDVRVAHVRIEGLQISATAVETTSAIVSTGEALAEPDLRISHNILRGAGDTASTLNFHMGIAIDSSSAEGGVVRIWNNVIYDFLGQGDYTGGIFVSDANLRAAAYAYNNTVFNCRFGIFKGHHIGVFKNNLSYGNEENYRDWFTAHPDSQSNLSGPTSDAPGANAKNATRVLFVDPAGRDLHLSPDDTGASLAGVNLSADPILVPVDDLDGQARPQSPGAFSIGADEP